MNLSSGTRGRSLITLSLVVLLMATALSAVLIVLPENVSGAFRFVGENSTYENLQDAIDDAQEDDIIIIGEGIVNGSFKSTKSDLYIRGNSSSSSIIRLNGSMASSLTGDNLLMEKVTIENGTLEIASNNCNVSDVVIGRDSGLLYLKNSTGSDLKNITFSDPAATGLIIYNCTSLKIDGLSAYNVTSELARIESSQNVNIEGLDMVIGEHGTSLRIDSSGSITIVDPRMVSIGSNGVGISAGNSSGIDIRRGNISVNGKGVDIENSSFITLTLTNIETMDLGSVGVAMDLVDNITFDRCSIQVNHGGTGVYQYRFERTEMANCSSLIFEDGIALIFELGSRMSITNSSFFELGSNSTGAVVKDVHNSLIKSSDWSSPSNDTIFLDLSSLKGFLMEDLQIDIEGHRSTGVHGVMNLEDSDLKDTTIEIDGSLCRGISLENWKDSIITGNRVDVNGDDSLGISFYSTATMSYGNVVTVSGRDSLGYSVTGKDLASSGDRIYTSGVNAISMTTHNLMEAKLHNIYINNTGASSVALNMAGSGGTYWINNSRLFGNAASAQLVMVQDPASLASISNTSMISASGDEVLFASALILDLMRSTIKGFGPGIMVMDTPSLNVVDSTINGSVALRTVSSMAKLIDSKLDMTSGSIEAFADSQVNVLDSGIAGVVVDPSSNVTVSHTMFIRTVDRFGSPLSGVDLEILREGYPIYSTPHFEPTDPDPATDLDGRVGPLILDHRVYIGEPMGALVNNTVNVYLQGTSQINWMDSYSIETSSPGTFQISSPDIDIPMVPANLRSFPLDTREDLLLNWTANSDDTLEYRIFQLDTEDPTKWLHVGTVMHPSHSWTTTGLGPAERRLFRITAWDGTWESEPSEITTAMTKDLTPPQTPSGFDVIDVGLHHIELIWEHPGEDDLAGFELFMNRTGEKELELISLIPAETRGYRIEGLPLGTTYRFKIQAVDDVGNPSQPTPTLEVTTRFPVLTVEVNALYEDEGPLAGLPVFNGTASLVTFNGTVEASTTIDSMGRAEFRGLDIDELYAVHITPPSQWIGEYNLSDGYIPMMSNFSSFTWENINIIFEMTLPYYTIPRTGSIEILVTYGPGPRSGTAFNSFIELMDGDDNVISTGSTDADGKLFFLIDRLPFRGRFDVTPPAGTEGDIQNNRSGYLRQRTNYFELDPSDPDYGVFPVELVYYEYDTPPTSLLVIKHTPMGANVSLDEFIVIGFDQPVERDSVEASIRIIPALNGIEFFWNSGSTEITISHEGFLPGKDYRVEITYVAVSVNGTTFPEEYTENIWTFRTTHGKVDEKDKDAGISDTALWMILIIIAALIVILGIYLKTSRKGQEKDLTDDYPYSEEDEYYDEEFEDEYDEDDLEEDEEYLEDDVFDDFPLDEEFEDELDIEEEEDDLEDETLEDDEGMDEVMEEEEPMDEESPSEEGPDEDEGKEDTKEEEDPVRKKKKVKKKKRS